MSAGHGPPVRVVFPHQLFLEHLDAPEGTVVVLVEHDLLCRQYAFHAQKLVLHRASCARFADRLRDAGREVHVLESRADRDSEAALTDLLRDLAPEHVSAYDVVDDWLARSLRRSVEAAGTT